MRAQVYSNLTHCAEYIQSIQGRLSTSICDFYELMSPAHCHFKTYANSSWTTVSDVQRCMACTLLNALAPCCKSLPDVASTCSSLQVLASYCKFLHTVASSCMLSLQALSLCCQYLLIVAIIITRLCNDQFNNEWLVIGLFQKFILL